MNEASSTWLPPGLRLDHGSDLPLHRQAGQLLRDLIRRPEYQNGALLPEEVTLAARLGISRGTLRLAIGQLVQDGLLERRAGVGTRVRSQPTESGVGAWRSFSLEMARQGIRVENYRQDFALAAAEAAAARALRIEPQAKIWRLDRVRGWDGRPVLHSRSWFHPRLGLTGREEFSRPLYEVIQRETGAVAETAREEFAAVAAKATLAKSLGVKRGAPLLLRSHTVFDAGGRLMEFAQVHYVSPRFALTLEIRRDDK
ncbi:MAG TPA: GntR family transcriptional regulator [Candidatus Acidoferrales bacterium]|nr:GntR family transcriptional regulator [Candidatus Acidoferrales bacterium]